MLPRRLNSCLLILFAAAASHSVARGDAGWPGLRGPDKTGAVNGRLIDGDTAGLSVAWKRDLGAGYSAPVVGAGRVMAMFAAGEDDVLAAFDVNSGDELWRYRVGKTHAGHSGSHDGPISTPLLAAGRVFGLGAWGDLFAVDAATGKPVWAKHAVEDFSAKAPFYGFATAPILVDGVLVVEVGAPEGKAIVGLDPENGAVKWTVGDDGVNYQSPIAGTIAGRRQVVAVTDNRLYGIDARTGETLWSTEHGGDARAMGGGTIVPVPAGEGRFFLMNRIDSSTMFQVTAAAEGGYEVASLWANRAISRSYVPPVYHGGFLYGISGRILTCVDAATGEMKWRSRPPGDGFLTMVGQQLIVMTKPGSLHLATISPDGYHEMSRIDLFDEHSWSEVAIASGHLFARSMGHLARVDVTSSGRRAEAAGTWLASTDFGRFLTSLSAGEDQAERIDAYLARQKTFPIVEGSDVVHFIYRGEAEDMGIVGDMIGFRREDPMQRVAGTDLFYYSIRLEPDAAVTYGFIKDYGEPIPDPRNPIGADGLFGKVSWLAMPAWQPPGFIGEAAEGTQGRLESVTWEREVASRLGDDEKTVKQEWTAQVYLPAGFDPTSSRRYPTLYVHDGGEALDKGMMRQSLDNLIGSAVEPLIAVFVLPPATDSPFGAMGPAGPYAEMLANDLVPLIDSRYPTVRDARGRATFGTGNGGAAAVVSAFQHPEVFGRLGSQSAFLFDMPMDKMLAEHDVPPPLSIFMEWGTYDMRSPHEAWDMVRENRQAWEFLRSAGYRPAGGEVPEGQGWACWRAHTDEMLAALFPLRPPA
ncbi:MAG: PQQ-binding-like beta-propeller repeat protein [Acidobacteriota bacterium]